MSTRQPLSSTQEDGVSQEYNREANVGNVCGEEGDRGDYVNVTNKRSGIVLVRGRRAHWAWVKQGMRGSGTRGSQHRLNRRPGKVANQ